MYKPFAIEEYSIIYYFRYVFFYHNHIRTEAINVTFSFLFPFKTVDKYFLLNNIVCVQLSI